MSIYHQHIYSYKHTQEEVATCSHKSFFDPEFSID